MVERKMINGRIVTIHYCTIKLPGRELAIFLYDR